MYQRAIELLGAKLGALEAGNAILQARLEQAEHDLQEAKAKLEELEAETEAENGIIE